MQTIIHHYSFHTNDVEQAKAYDEMCERIRADGKRDFMNCWGEIDKGNHEQTVKEYNGKLITLEIEYVFSNQWNSAECGRVFDWYEEYPAIISKSYKHGHWLEITDEMRKVRRNTVKCGYCGNHTQRAQEYVFCMACLDSEYLKEKDLKLLRVASAGEHRPKYSELTDAEKAYLLPLYVKRQTTGTDSRAVRKREKQKRDIQKKYKKETYSAKTEHDGMMWLWEHKVNLDNVIYYSHTDSFCFGWRNPLGVSVESALLDLISEFPHAYTIKGANGVKEGY